MKWFSIRFYHWLPGEKGGYINKPCLSFLYLSDAVRNSTMNVIEESAVAVSYPGGKPFVPLEGVSFNWESPMEVVEADAWE